MRLRPLCAVVLLILLAPIIAHAHDHRWDASASSGWADGSNLLGGRISFGVTTKKPDNEDLSVLFDVGYFQDRDPSRIITLRSFLLGPRYSLEITDKNIVTLHAIAGVVHKHEPGVLHGNKGAVMLGGAYEWVPRGSPQGIATRVQIDYTIVPSKDVKSYLQITGGLAFRWGD
jgi:hypothetical protein